MQAEDRQGTQSYPSHVRWDIRLDGDFTIKKILSKRLVRLIELSIEKIQNSPYRFSFEPADIAFVQRFLPIYERTVRSKRGIVDDIFRVMEVDKIKAGDYQSLSLYRNDDLIGANIIHTFNVNHQRSQNLYYRALPREINVRLPAAVGLGHISDFLLIKHAVASGASVVNSGKDLNPFGISPHPAIGLALYKLHMGYTPSSSVAGEMKDVGRLKVTRDTLVFLASEMSQPITDAILFVNNTKTGGKKYLSLFHQNKVNIELKKW